MNFWPFPILRNYRTSPEVDAIFQRFIDATDMEVTSRTEHETTVTCKDAQMAFWTANKFYAFGMSGRITMAGGKRFEWAGEMPSRIVVRRMYKKLLAAMKVKFQEVA